jgi:hypothetical protein
MFAHQTLWRQQCEATLAHFCYEHDCCRHAALTKEHHPQAVATCAKAIVNEVTEWLHQADEEALRVQC